jgi:hypothetical protein
MFIFDHFRLILVFLTVKWQFLQRIRIKHKEKFFGKL